MVEKSCTIAPISDASVYETCAGCDDPHPMASYRTTLRSVTPWTIGFRYEDARSGPPAMQTRAGFACRLRGRNTVNWSLPRDGTVTALESHNTPVMQSGGPAARVRELFILAASLPAIQLPGSGQRMHRRRLTWLPAGCFSLDADLWLHRNAKTEFISYSKEESGILQLAKR
jgi:hypothetical protein